MAQRARRAVSGLTATRRLRRRYDALVSAPRDSTLCASKRGAEVDRDARPKPPSSARRSQCCPLLGLIDRTPDALRGRRVVRTARPTTPKSKLGRAARGDKRAGMACTPAAAPLLRVPFSPQQNAMLICSALTLLCQRTVGCVCPRATSASIPHRS